MTERFSAPGATLVKLFGRPGDESAEFAARAGRCATSACARRWCSAVFVTALTLVSALALALVYGLGGLLRAARAGWSRAPSSRSRCC